MPVIPSTSELTKSRDGIENPHREDSWLGYLYHENSKYGRRKSLKEFYHFGQIRNDPDTIKTFIRHFKGYDDVPKIELPMVSFNSPYSFEEIVLKRRSVRDYSNEPISFERFANLLVLSYGITGSMPYDVGEDQFLRAAPSAGALYPLEIYPVVFNVSTLEKGLYHFNVKDRCLELLKPGDFLKESFSLFCDQEVVLQSGALLIITAMTDRSMYKYKNRGMRFIYMDAGHLGQQIYLCATAQDLGACALGGFYDYEVEKFLDIDGFYETALYGITLGPMTKEDHETSNDLRETF